VQYGGIVTVKANKNFYSFCWLVLFPVTLSDPSCPKQRWFELLDHVAHVDQAEDLFTCSMSIACFTYKLETANRLPLLDLAENYQWWPQTSEPWSVCTHPANKCKIVHNCGRWWKLLCSCSEQATHWCWCWAAVSSQMTYFISGFKWNIVIWFILSV